MQPITPEGSFEPFRPARVRTAVIASAVLAPFAFFAASLWSALSSPSTTVADRVSNPALEESLQSARIDHEGTVTALNQARARANAARSRLESLLASHFGEPVEEVEPPSAVDDRPAVEPQSRSVPNPAWQELTNRLNILSASRQQLLVRVTEEHPEVRYLDLQLAEVARLRASLPEFITEVVEAPAAIAKTREALAPAAKVERERRRRRAVAGEYEQAQRQVDQTQRELGEAEAGERRAEMRAANLTAQVSLASQIMPLPNSGGMSSTWALASVAAALVLIAVAAASMMRARSRPTFRTALEVESVLDTPVLGVIPEWSSDEPEAPQALHREPALSVCG